MRGTFASRARVFALVFPLYGLVTSAEVGCGSATTNSVSTTGALYGQYGQGPGGHYGFYGYYGCTAGYGYMDSYGVTGCDDGQGYDPYGFYP